MQLQWYPLILCATTARLQEWDHPTSGLGVMGNYNVYWPLFTGPHGRYQVSQSAITGVITTCKKDERKHCLNELGMTKWFFELPWNFNFSILSQQFFILSLNVPVIFNLFCRLVVTEKVLVLSSFFQHFTFRLLSIHESIL